ncbi:TonB-dependent receptor [Flavitalea sp. BT771]|uniref:SusC/RagA family TonB-linked outer membrane protein n=1 Tax=Flavitalea sp. BT771 TaxID=3063329 RepID=UPI0026E29C8B|nr:TonB-dependent receptor [Flavitalea sp. BT771]MDO6435248.1 TonB-dependent receptor [Flavitalea sp. BT771]MDV6224047.1 TonB-dependent receptor [Flavitalea sp. BT771]
MKKKLCHSHPGRLSPGRNRIFYLLLLLQLFTFLTNAQKTPLPPRGEPINRVGGTVLDSKGNPLPGVSVTIKSTGMGTTTDSSGKFRITVPGPQSVLVFSLVSYENKEETVGRKVKMVIALNEAANSLNDVVVIGYGTAKKRDLAGSITSISAKQLEERHPASLGDALQGMAAGVLVTTSAVPGAQPSIRIRGYSTFSSAGNNPLYVIDGVLSDNMDWVNPNDVQSVEILKDAASAAIYGSRSANGVIIVTTKRGVEGKPRINVQYLHTSGILAHKLPQANSREVRLYRQEQSNSPTAGGNTDSLNPSFNADNDYQDLLTRTALKNQVDFGISGGARNMNYFTSIRALDDQGLVVNSYAKSLLLRANIEFSPSTKFKYTSRFNFGYTTGNKIDEGNTIFQAFQRPANYAVFFPDGTLTGYISGRRNPLSVALLQVNRNQNYQGGLFNQIEYTFIPSLKFTTNAVVNYSETRTQGFLPKLLSSANPTTNAGSEGFSRTVNWQYQAFFNYNKTFGKDHAVTGLAGFSAENTQTNSATLADVNYVSEEILTLNSGTLVPSGTTTSATGNSLASLFGRASYSYKGKYILNALVRRDGSSRFGANNRWGNFVSGAVAWRFTDERFMNWSGNVLDDGKLRVSVGQTGNERIGNFDAQSKYDFGTYFYNAQSGVAPNSAVGNPNLKWESTLQSDVGLDLSFFKGRLLVVADYYVKTTSDMLYSRPLPRETGYSSVRVNVGTVQNKGFELTLTGRPLVRRDFDWLVSSNLSIERGVVKKLNGGQSFISGNSSDAGNAAWLIREGGALGDFYGWKQVGVYAYDQSNAYNDNWERLTPNFDKNGVFQGYTFKGQPYTGAVHSVYGRSTKLKGGDVEFANLTKDSVIDNADRTVLGNAQPKFYLALMNTLHYKQFTLSFTFNTQWGNKIYNNAARVLDDYGTSNIIPQPYVIHNMWRKQGDVTDVPVYRSSSVGNVRVSDRFIEDGSFIRLAYLQLNYTLPPALSRKMFAQSANCYIYGSNLLTWTNYTWYDPEFTSSDPLQLGQDGGNYPRRREIGLGINIYF